MHSLDALMAGVDLFLYRSGVHVELEVRGEHGMQVRGDTVEGLQTLDLVRDRMLGGGARQGVVKDGRVCIGEGLLEGVDLC